MSAPCLVHVQSVLTKLLVLGILRPHVDWPLVLNLLHVLKTGVDQLLLVLGRRPGRGPELVAGFQEVLVPLGERAVLGQGTVITGKRQSVRKLQPTTGIQVPVTQSRLVYQGNGLAVSAVRAHW